MDTSLLALDVGTSRIKCGFLTRAGQFHLAYAAAAPLAHEETGAATQDPEQVLRLCLEGLRRCAAEAPAPEGLALTGQMGGLILVDGTGRALTPWFTSMDSRSRQAGESLRQEAGVRVRRLSACAPQDAEIVLWATQTMPHLPADARALLLAPYIATQLAREGSTAAYCDRTSLCWTGMADTAAARWDAELARAAQWSVRQLPPIVEPGTVVGSLSAAMAEATGLPVGLPLIAAPGDQAAGLYGLGCTEPGMLVDSASTFPLLVGVTSQYAVPACERIELMPSAAHGKWHPLAYMLGSGSILSWFAERVAHASLAELEREAEAVGGVSGILALPFGAQPGALGSRSVFWGVDAAHGRGHLYRALLEGLACEYALMARDLAAEGVRCDPPVVAIGGGTGSKLLTRLKATLIGQPWRCLPDQEMALAGAALHAAHALGWDVTLPIPEGEVIWPVERERAAYQALLERYTRFRSDVARLESIGPA